MDRETKHRAAEFTRSIALEVCKKEVLERFGNGTRYPRDQISALAVDMAVQGATETIRLNEGLDGLQKRLEWAFDFLASLQAGGRSKKLDELIERHWKEPEKSSDIEKSIVERAKISIWECKDLMASYRGGEQSLEFYWQSIDWITGLLRNYLERPWARYPMIDWIFLGMMLTTESCKFAENYKNYYLPGPKDEFGMHKFYVKHAGDIAKMQSDREGYWDRLLIELFWGCVLPITVIVAASQFYERVGIVLGAIYASIIALLCITKFVFFIADGLTLPSEKFDPARKYYNLVMLMRDTLHTLDGTVINPTRVREAMQNAASAGAVWDEAAWALIDRVKEIDPNIWITEPRGGFEH